MKLLLNKKSSINNPVPYEPFSGSKSDRSFVTATLSQKDALQKRSLTLHQITALGLSSALSSDSFASFTYGTTEAWNGLGWRRPWRSPSYNPLPWVGTPSTTPDCSKLHPAWHWTLLRMEPIHHHPKVKNFFLISIYHLCPIPACAYKKCLSSFLAGPF